MLKNKLVKYKNKPTTLKYGHYFYMNVTLPFVNKEKERTLRIWLPEDYEFDNPNKRFPVIYFSDGQNLVDRYLSAYGDWELDKHVHNLLKEGIRSFIAVGLDCPKDPFQRAVELNPPYKSRNKSYNHTKVAIGNKYIDYFADEIKPFIDNNFFTLKEKEFTGIGGSSMGGIMSFFAYIYRPDVFGYSLSFSPAFFFYGKREWEAILDSFNIDYNKNGKLVLYSGGKDFESKFLKPTINTYFYLKNRLKDEQVKLIVDTEEIHHEKAWSKYLEEALRFWLK